jgi:hypothetical protein
MGESLRISRYEYERVRIAWVQMEINQPKFAKMFAPLGEEARPFPHHDPSPIGFLRKHVERQQKITNAKRDYTTEQKRLSDIFDQCAQSEGVVIEEEQANRTGEP